MSKATTWWTVIVAAALVFSLVPLGRAAAPWETLLTQNRVEADPQKPYRLSEENGPWLIMACSFSGEGAGDQAHQLALELRKRYKLPAYVHAMKFDFTRTGDAQSADRFAEPVKRHYQRGDAAEEIAVLVGDYSSMDDPDAKATLRKLKVSTPLCLQAEEGKKTNQTLAGFREIQRRLLAGGNDKKRLGPMGHAFLVPNPLLRGQQMPKGLDPLVVAMNKGLKYSLLDCPGKYTVQVATFTGKIVVDQSAIRQIQSGQKDLDESRLDEAAQKAHKLTIALRAEGYEAYEYHERCASVVTVGSFESVGTPRPDGKIEINPQVHRIMETFKGKPPAGGGPIGSQLVVGIPLDIQPLPVPVPKQSISTAQARPAAGLW